MLFHLTPIFHRQFCTSRMAEDLLALKAELVVANQKAEIAEKRLLEAEAMGLNTTLKENVYTSAMGIVASIQARIVEGIDCNVILPPAGTLLMNDAPLYVFIYVFY